MTSHVTNHVIYTHSTRDLHTLGTHNPKPPQDRLPLKEFAHC